MASPAPIRLPAVAMVALTALAVAPPLHARPLAAPLDSPFAVTARDARAATLQLRLEAGAARRLRLAHDAGGPFRLHGFELPGRRVDLDLRPIRVTPPGFRAIVVGAGGTRPAVPSVATFAGSIAGERSYAFLAVSPTQAHGYVIDAGDRTFILSSGDPRRAAGGLTIADAAVLRAAAPPVPWTCTVLGLAPQAPPAMEQGLHVEGPQVRIADMFVEVDPGLRALFDTAEDAADYALAVLAAVSDIYRRDVAGPMRVPDGYLRVWEVTPPWGDPDLDAFKNYWRSDENPLQDLPRTTVHLFSHPVFGGIAGGFGGICSTEAGYELSTLYGFFPTPIQHTHPDNWDLVVVAHEYGHSFGSVHTFDYEPPIECDDGSGPDAGTLMSYCHQNPGGIENMGLRFHARVQDTISNTMAAAQCLEVVDLAPGDWDYDGALDAADLQAAQTCLDLGFEAAGCLDCFDLDGDGELTGCDYAILEAIVDPQKQAEDCNDNGVPDSCEDCNGNGLADECDIADGTSTDCDGNGVADECEALYVGDCNDNSMPDYCDIVTGASDDVEPNGVPDECQQVRAVPGAYATIQAAIDAAGPGDVVLLEDGVYSGPGNRDLDFGGRILTVRSANGPGSCVIDAGDAGRGFVFQSGESAASRVEGLTIRNGSADVGAGILCTGGSAPVIAGCVIEQCAAATSGGGIACVGGSAPTIVDCTVTGCTTAGLGGGGFCDQSAPLLQNTLVELNTAGDGAGLALITGSDALVLDCTIASNQAAGDGGGVLLFEGSHPRIERCALLGNAAVLGGGLYSSTSQPQVTSCLVAGNTATSRGGGMRLWVSSNPTIRNCTFVDNLCDANGNGHAMSFQAASPTIESCIIRGQAAGPQIDMYSFAIVFIRYSNVQGGRAGISADDPFNLVWGSGNIDLDPLFADPGAGDYRLSEGSPSVDAGDPAFEDDDATDLDGNPRLADGDGDLVAIVDMGAYERPGSCPGDLDADGLVGIADLIALLAAWGPNPGHPADLDGSGDVNVVDLIALLAAWGPC